MSEDVSVISPLLLACCSKYLLLFLIINLATNKDSGVRITTARARYTFILIMNTRVTIIVTTPMKNWLKPRSNPSLITSQSTMILLTISPSL